MKPEQPVQPRLLNIHAAAAYLSVSTWTIRSFVARGQLGTVKLPSVRYKGESNRRLLFDRVELDKFIERYLDASVGA